MTNLQRTNHNSVQGVIFDLEGVHGPRTLPLIKYYFYPKNKLVPSFPVKSAFCRFDLSICELLQNDMIWLYTQSSSLPTTDPLTHQQDLFQRLDNWKVFIIQSTISTGKMENYTSVYLTQMNIIFELCLTIYIETRQNLRKYCYHFWKKCERRDRRKFENLVFMAFSEFACDLGNFPRKVAPPMGCEKTN